MRRIKVLVVFMLVLTLMTGNQVCYAKAKPKLNIKTYSAKVGASKKIKLKNVKRYVDWKTSNNRIKITKVKGKYGNSVTIKIMDKGKSTLTAIYNGKKYKCKIKGIGTGAFQYAENSGYDIASWKFVSTSSKNGKIMFPIVYDATNIKFEKKKMSYSVKKAWLAFDVQYSIEPDIHSVADCERKVQSIVKQLPSTLPIRDSIFLTGGVGMPDFEDLIIDNKNVDKAWCAELTSFGSGYFYEESSHTSLYDIVFRKLYSESYIYIDGVAIKCRIDIKSHNYKDFLESYDTVTERNDFQLMYRKTRYSLETVTRFISEAPNKYGDDILPGADYFSKVLFSNTKLIP